MSDPRGPERKILSKKLNLDSTVLTLSCGHKVEKNAIYTYNVGEMSHCIPCLEEEEEAPEKDKFACREHAHPAHTPTPWKMRQEIRTIPKRLVEDKKGITDFYTDGDLIMGLPVKKLVAQCEYLNEANAAYIVKCVNAHEELVAFIKACLDSKSADELLDFVQNNAEKIVAEAEGR